MVELELTVLLSTRYSTLTGAVAAAESVTGIFTVPTDSAAAELMLEKATVRVAESLSVMYINAPGPRE